MIKCDYCLKDIGGSIRLISFDTKACSITIDCPECCNSMTILVNQINVDLASVALYERDIRLIEAFRDHLTSLNLSDCRVRINNAISKLIAEALNKRL